jgi:carotenoid cleavage dioxygenase-like enzyme
LTPCTYSGTIPEELFGGEYVRNGGSPVSNEDLGRDAHWFDGDGMISGVSFTRIESGVQPDFVNQYILTDVFLSTISSPSLKRPVLPSISTLVNPIATLISVTLHVFRTLLLVLLSHLPGSQQAIKRISVANTAVIFHDGRALATCESGPPMRISLPSLETVGWYNGKRAEGEPGGEDGPGFGGEGMLSFLKEFTTAHPKIDPKTGEMLLFHSTFAPPFVHYSIIPATHPPAVPQTPLEVPTRLLNARVPGISSAKMMHDFGVGQRATVIMDLPLSLDPMNMLKNKPVVAYEPTVNSRFGVFPRHRPEDVRWFETKACCIFHTANTWEDTRIDQISGQLCVDKVNMLACRLMSASLVFAAGNLPIPEPVTGINMEEEQCRLYYYQFDLTSSQNIISHQFALSAINFEFPSTRDDVAMTNCKYIYGCSTSAGGFGAALGKAAKIDCLAKINAQELIRRGRKDPSIIPVTGCVDQRSIQDVIDSVDQDDPIKVLQLPYGCFAQEPRFVPRAGSTEEDDGWLLTYVFDEAQLDEDGECLPDARSELWIIDARDMKTIVGRVHLPQRVPYGLHGIWCNEEQIRSQRPVETIRSIREARIVDSSIWWSVRRWIENFLG